MSGIFTIQSPGGIPHQPFYLTQQPFRNCYAPPVFCFFQLRMSNMSESWDLRGLRTVSLLGWTSQ